MKELEALRRRIDEADQDLIDALARRMSAVDEILERKESQGLALIDADREKALIARLAEDASRRKLDPRLMERVVREVISHSRATQARRVQHRGNPELSRATRVGFQGGRGAYSWMALHRHFHEDVESIGFAGFREVLDALESRRIDLAFLPIENTLIGSIHEAYELLSESAFHVIGEEVLRIEHCLIGLAPGPLQDIDTVISHPVALQQCRTFLQGLANAKCESYVDTAEAVRRIKEEGDPRRAAIAGQGAADLYGLSVLREGIADHVENYTRFWAIARQPVSVDPRLPSKTSLLLITDHREGALVQCLKAFDTFGINMTKLESRPRRGTPWQYQFYLDVDGNLSDEPLRQALDAVRRRARLLRILGCYPRHEAKTAVPYLAEAWDTDRRRKAARQSPSPTPVPRLVRGSTSPASPVMVGSVEVGAGRFAVLARPLHVSSSDELEEWMSWAAAAGVDIVLGDHGSISSPETDDDVVWDWFRQAAERHRLPLACPISAPGQIAKLPSPADLIWVAAGEMRDLPLLRELGRLAQPILLQRAPGAKVEEWMAAAETILSEGNQQVILCEAGVRTFEGTALDLGVVAEVKQQSGLPVVVDPGTVDRTPTALSALVKASQTAGADGVVLRTVRAAEAADLAVAADLIFHLAGASPE